MKKYILIVLVIVFMFGCEENSHQSINNMSEKEVVENGSETEPVVVSVEEQNKVSTTEVKEDTETTTLRTPIYTGEFVYKEGFDCQVDSLYSYTNKLVVCIEGDSIENINELVVGDYILTAVSYDGDVKSDDNVVTLKIIAENDEG